MVSTTSPKVAAQASKWSMPRSTEPVRIEVALDGIHFHHGVADGRAGGEGDAVAGVLLVQEARFHVEVEGPFAAAGLNTRHPFHFGRGLEILEVVTLVNVDVVNAQLVKDQAVVFFSAARRSFRRSSRLAFCFSMVLMMLRCARDVSAAALSQRSWSYSAICSRKNRSW